MSECSIFSTILRPLTTGLLALLPVGLTVAIVAWLVNFLANILGMRSQVGAIVCVPKGSVTPLECGIDGLFNIYMSMGTMVPDYLRKTQATP